MKTTLLTITLMMSHLIAARADVGHEPTAKLARERQRVVALTETAQARLDRAVKMSMSLSREEFDSPIGLQLMQNIVRLASATQEAQALVKERPGRLHAGEYTEILKKMQDVCEELAE
jgi:hypothetical protein